MNLKDYKSSGILELYVSGALSPEEHAEVESLISKYPELAVEVEEIENALANFSLAFSKEPPRDIKENILAEIDILEKDSASQEAKVVALSSTSSPLVKYSVAASVALLLLGNFYFYNQWRSTEKQLAGLVNQNYKLAQNYDLIKATYEKTQHDFTIATANSFKQIEMQGLPLYPSGKARVFWNEKSQETYVLAVDLPKPEYNKQFQLWAIVDGKPVDAGVFDFENKSGELLKMNNITGAQAFAVTIEPKGGSINPSMDQMVVFSKI